MHDDTIGGRKRWEVNGDLSSLESAEEIRNDEKRMAAVSLLANEKLGPLKRLARWT